MLDKYEAENRTICKPNSQHTEPFYFWQCACVRKSHFLKFDKTVALFIYLYKFYQPLFMLNLSKPWHTMHITFQRSEIVFSYESYINWAMCNRGFHDEDMNVVNVSNWVFMMIKTPPLISLCNLIINKQNVKKMQQFKILIILMIQKKKCSSLHEYWSIILFCLLFLNLPAS